MAKQNGMGIMKKFLQFLGGAGLAATLGATGALAGGLDRSGQSVGILFQSGNVVELSFGYVDPNVTGTDPATLPTGDMAPAYIIPSVALKFDIGDKLSAALIVDSPYGADAAYSTGFYTGTNADLNSSAVTALLGYKVAERVLVFAGVSYQTISATAALPPVAGYTINASSGSGTGYVAGVAYQIPEIAMRVALTYRSTITSTHTTLEFGAIPGAMTLVTPQSVNLEFQTGINPKTLVFGSIRWVDWSSFAITPPSYPLGSLVSYTNDVLTYSLGVGRKINDQLSLAATLGYERSTGAAPSALAPTDGNISLGIGATYKVGSGKLTGGVRYIWLGDAAGPAGTFTGNHAVALGLKYAWEF